MRSWPGSSQLRRNAGLASDSRARSAVLRLGQGLAIIWVVTRSAGAALPADQRTPSAVDSREGQLPDAQEVVARHVEAVGGRAALANVHSRRVWARFEVVGERVSGQVQMLAARPDKLLVKTTYGDMATSVTGFDGEVGWVEGPGAKPALVRGKQLAQLRDDADFDIDLRGAPAYHSVQTVARAEFGGRPCYRLRVVRASSRELSEYFDVATGLFAGSVARRETDTGPVTVTTVVHKYKAFGGVKVPVRLSIKSAGVEQLVTVISVKHNDVDAGVFALPPQLRTQAAR